MPNKLPDAVVEGDNMMDAPTKGSGQLEGVPTSEILSWLRHSINPTSQRAADEIERLQAIIDDARVWIDREIDGMPDDTRNSPRARALKEVRAKLAGG